LKKPDYNIDLPNNVRNIVGMCSENERKFLMHYASNVYSGEGKIVDCGCWLGATTIALACGLLFNQNKKNTSKPVFAYDRFLWDDSLEKQVLGTKYEAKLKEKESFKELFEENVKEYLALIEVRTDIVKSGWHGEEIEFLLIDVMKTPVIAKSIIQQFYPFLIPGVSMVYHQDFDHYLTPWVHILIYLHKPYFKHIHDIYGRGGTVFLSKKPVPESILETDFMNVDEDVADNSFKYCISIASVSKRNGIAAAHVMYYVYQGKPEKAFRLWTDYLWRNFELTSDFISVKKMIDKSGFYK